MRGALTLPEDFFDDAFDKGLSTLRLIRYPVRTDAEQASAVHPDVWVTHRGNRQLVTGAPHVDSGFLTLLAQDGIGGLQARHRNGQWTDVPPSEGTLAVNFGKVLERWSLGRIKATEHRVISAGQPRMSIPFFYEARADAEIRPLPMDAGDSFEPFLYGDYLWTTTTQFLEFKGMESLRRHRSVRSGSGHRMTRLDRRRLEIGVFPYRCQVATRFADLDQLGHINNVAVTGILAGGARMAFCLPSISSAAFTLRWWSQRRSLNSATKCSARIPFTFLSDYWKSAEHPFGWARSQSRTAASARMQKSCR